LVFGYFFSRNLAIIQLQLQKQTKGYLFLFFVVLILVIPMWSINGVRYYTAANAFIYGVLHIFLLNKKKRGLFYIAISPLIHWSFFFTFPILIIYYFLGSRYNIFLILYLVSFFISSIAIEPLQNIANTLAPVFADKTQVYSDADYMLERQESYNKRSIYSLVFINALKYQILMLILYVHFVFVKKGILKRNRTIYSLYNFSLFFMGVFYTLDFIPSVGRFNSITNFLFIALFIIIFQKYSVRSNEIIYITIPLSFVFILGKLYSGSAFIGPFTFTNPILALWGPGESTLWDIFIE